MSPRYGTLCKGLEVLGFRRKQQLADRKSAKDRAEPWMANRGRLRQEPIYYRAESVALLILHTCSVPGTHRRAVVDGNAVVLIRNKYLKKS